MNYATVDKNGKFTGVVYSEMNDNIQKWHDDNGYSYTPVNVSRLENLGTDNEPDYGYPMPEHIPDVAVVTKLQFVEWCEANNKLDDLLTLLNSDTILKVKWDAATRLEITNPLVQWAAMQLQLDAQAVFNEIGQRAI